MTNPQFNPYVSNVQQQLTQAYQNAMQQIPQVVPQPQGCYMQIVNDESIVLGTGLGPGQSRFFYNPDIGMLYLKATNQNNIPEPLRYFKVTEVTGQQNQIAQQPQPVQATLEQVEEPITRKEFQGVVDSLAQIQASLKELME